MHKSGNEIVKCDTGKGAQKPKKRLDVSLLGHVHR